MSDGNLTAIGYGHSATLIAGNTMDIAAVVNPTPPPAKNLAAMGLGKQPEVASVLPAVRNRAGLRVLHSSWGPAASLKPIDEIDGLRACAVLLVIAWHYVGIPDGPDYWLWRIFYFGRFGVDLFFVISGFLIATILLQNRQSSNYYRTFYGRRVLRIWPLYYLMCALCLIGSWSGFARGLFQGNVPGWPYLFGIQNFWMAKAQDYGFLWLGGTWSLAIEEQFYLVFPVIVRAVPPTILPRLLLAVIVICPIGRLFDGMTGDQFGYYVLPQFRADVLCIGAWVAWWRVYGDRANFVITRIAWRLLLVSALGPLLIWLSGSAGSHGAVWQHTLTGLCFGAVLFHVLEHQGASSLRCLRSGAAAFFARTSYAAYLTHHIVAFLIFDISGVQRTLRTATGISMTAVCFVATFALCELSYRYFERPLLRYGKERFRYGDSGG